MVNRSADRADVLAAQFGGRVESLENLDHWLGRADVIVSTTAATETLVGREQFEAIRRQTNRHAILILDLGVPRDFDPAVGTIDDNVFLYDIDALQTTCDRNRLARQSEVQGARQIIQKQTDGFLHNVYRRATGPVIERLRKGSADISERELEILFRRLSHLSEDDRAAVGKAVHRIVNKILHPPLETLRNEARTGTPHALLDALRRLFHLGDS